MERGAWALLCLFGGFAVYSGYQLGFGTVSRPGPGMWPVLVGVPTLAVSAFLLFTRLSDESESAEGQRRWAWLCMLGTAGLILGVPVLGMYLSVFLYCTLVPRFISELGWVRSLAVGAGVVLLCWLTFDLFLGVRVPTGAWF